MKTQEITPEMAEQLGAEYRKLIEQASEQLTQHKLWLGLQLQDLDSVKYGLTPELHAQLVSEAQLIKLEMVRLEPAITQGEKQTVTAVYEYPDAIHAFMSRVDIPQKFSLLTQGGITIDVEAPSLKV